MSNQIEIKIQVIIHATDDFEKITKSLIDVFNLNSDNFKIEDLTGHFENPIKILTLLIKKNCAVKFLAILFSQMSKNDIDVISQNLAEQITNTGLKIKISKQELIMGKIILDGRDAIKIIIIVPVYVKKNAEKIYRQILKI
tara:strand:- start:30 stop:452 length:423 start_codon:yes stop_codon:yes gene_type:complete